MTYPNPNSLFRTKEPDSRPYDPRIAELGYRAKNAIIDRENLKRIERPKQLRRLGKFALAAFCAGLGIGTANLAYQNIYEKNVMFRRPEGTFFNPDFYNPVENPNKRLPAMLGNEKFTLVPYVVKENDNLRALALKGYGSTNTVDNIVKAMVYINEITNPELIEKGRKILLPVRRKH